MKVGELAGTRIVVVLLALQFLSIVTVWTFSTVEPASENLFALFTAANLVSFAMISHVYRTLGRGGSANRSYLLGGLALIFLLLFVALLV